MLPDAIPGSTGHMHSGHDSEAGLDTTTANPPGPPGIADLHGACEPPNLVHAMHTHDAHMLDMQLPGVHANEFQMLGAPECDAQMHGVQTRDVHMRDATDMRGCAGTSGPHRPGLECRTAGPPQRPEVPSSSFGAGTHPTQPGHAHHPSQQPLISRLLEQHAVWVARRGRAHQPQQVRHSGPPSDTMDTSSVSSYGAGSRGQHDSPQALRQAIDTGYLAWRNCLQRGNTRVAQEAHNARSHSPPLRYKPCPLSGALHEYLQDSATGPADVAFASGTRQYVVNMFHVFFCSAWCMYADAARVGDVPSLLLHSARACADDINNILLSLDVSTPRLTRASAAVAERAAVLRLGGGP